MKVLAAACLLVCLFQAGRGQVLGGEEAADVTDPEILRLSQVALGHLNSKKGVGEAKAELVEIISATVQVVSGSSTKLTLKIFDNGAHKKCVVKIWEQSWLNRTEVTEANCEDFTD